MKRFNRWVTAGALAMAAAMPLSAQSVNLTGFVATDFAGLTTVVDPGGVDVSMPANFTGLTSGWDMKGLALHYDLASDTFFIGLDYYGIGGDADGNGDAGTTGTELDQIQGLDIPDLGAGETFVLVFDLNGDGVGDIMMGVEPGGNINDFKTTYCPPSLNLQTAHSNFGDPVAAAQAATVLGSPFDNCPDIEMSMGGFCELLNEFAGPGTESIGVYAFSGSFADSSIGDDEIADPQTGGFLTMSLSAFDAAGNLPILNNFRMKSVETIPQSPHFLAKTEYGVRPNYGCCLLFSLADNLAGWQVGAPFNVTVKVGVLGVPTYVIDLGVLASTVAASCTPKEGLQIIPAAIADMTVYLQMFSYPAPFILGVSDTYYTSNRVILHPGLYPVPEPQGQF
ncbi:MAG: hypothetical protein V3W41_03150 [Planctomycetota bacterium]